MGWKIESSEVVGDFDIMRVRRVIARPPKSEKSIAFHVVDTAQCVQIVGVTDDDRIIMVEQYRQGIAKRAIEFPGGLIDDGEDCEVAALRELREETGYSADYQVVIGRIATDPAMNSARMTIVAAFGCKRTDEKEEDEGESTRVKLVTRQEMERMIDTGEIESGDAVASWYLFNRYVSSNGSRP